MESSYVYLLMIAILLVGFIKTIYKYRVRKDDIDFALEYLKCYRNLAREYLSGQFDGDDYEWLTRNSTKIQIQILVLEWFGIAGEGSSDRFDNSRILIIFSGIIGIIGFLGTIIGIVVDWEQFSQLIKHFINKWV